jgi:hypothetical protein
MPHAIFYIDELLGLVVDELVATSPRTAVAFAVTCQSFEEPTLGSLWKEQRSLIDLVKVLPNYTRAQDEDGTSMIVSASLGVYCGSYLTSTPLGN